MKIAIKPTKRRVTVALVLALLFVVVTTLPVFHIARKSEVCVVGIDCGSGGTDYAQIERYGLPLTVVTYKTWQHIELTQSKDGVRTVSETHREGGINYAALVGNWLIVTAFAVMLAVVVRKK